MFFGLLHPDFVYDLLTEKQLMEIGWYYERHPFGHDVDHMMQARIAASMSGEPEPKLMPMVKRELTLEQQMAQFPGLAEFKESLENGNR